MKNVVILDQNASTIILAKRYHQHEATVIDAAKKYSPCLFLRLFITYHGMPPIGTWQTHTYAKYYDDDDQQSHFFLIPMQNQKEKNHPHIRFVHDVLFIDEFKTNIVRQAIPHTTPFWYFHYYPNTEHSPFRSMTLNLSPQCLEKCVLCAGAKTGRVNNGLNQTLNELSMVNNIFQQYPNAIKELESVAVVTGCFNDYSSMAEHLFQVKKAINQFCTPATFRVLEHNIVTPQQFEHIIGELGYDIFITLECFDQKIRNIALNGKVGRKGRNSTEFLDIIESYATYLEHHPELAKHVVHVTYLMGLDSLKVTEELFAYLAKLNQNLKSTQILPWLSIFTTYNNAMRTLANANYNFSFLIASMELAKKYFDPLLLASQSGTTGEGYARGLF